MYFEIAAIAAVIIFAILSFYIIRTLISLQHTLRRVDLIALEMDCKIKHLDSTIKAVSNLGDICEEKTARLREQYLQEKERESQKLDCSDDLADWLVASLKLGAKFIRRK